MSLVRFSEVSYRMTDTWENYQLKTKHYKHSSVLLQCMKTSLRMLLNNRLSTVLLVFF